MSRGRNGWGQGRERDRKATSQSLKARPAEVRSPSGLGTPLPWADDRGVLSAAFPEELPVDLKHRKLGEQGRWAGKRGPLQVHTETGI